MKIIALITLSILALLVPGVVHAELAWKQESTPALRRIEDSIRHLKPNLTDFKINQYARAILTASTRFQIEPSTLVAIAQQETSFREALPEGKAGEIGICQIRKMWLKNDKFREEFGKTTVADLHNPVKNFLYAAWILDDLKHRVGLGTLPYWSYYNAVRFENRFKYFLAVNRKLVKIKRRGLGQAAPLSVTYLEKGPKRSEAIAKVAKPVVSVPVTAQNDIVEAYNPPDLTKSQRRELAGEPRTNINLIRASSLVSPDVLDLSRIIED